ncbi:hypothetical protein [Paenibacillus macquariensis]|uniref:Uncharacterized protein n=1 Tax=Paenibacillus macquariensis TaxID=948756 RepID=A0ABY1JK18_9BACL|nr:hypothetical protein [Paenibacillus macquariensis]MEC0089842.1 hypothetical protein [Paenibacillus macquariensis]SIQ32446.1 hypothetical protein SAMN05421578_101222 [Paenibacillus macquariensis]
MRATKARSISKSGSSQQKKLNQLAFFASFLFLIAAIITIFIAWKNLSGTSATEVIV